MEIQTRNLDGISIKSDETIPIFVNMMKFVLSAFEACDFEELKKVIADEEAEDERFELVSKFVDALEGFYEALD